MQLNVQGYTFENQLRQCTPPFITGCEAMFVTHDISSFIKFLHININRFSDRANKNSNSINITMA